MTADSSGKRIKMRMGDLEVQGVLNGTRTAQAIWDAMPINASASTWGGEVFFLISVEEELEGGRETVDAGDLCYYPRRNAFCIFYGPTPVSIGDEVRPSGPITVIGKVAGDPQILRRVAAGVDVTVTRA